ncbi:hypothetical protein RB595_009962 [Gaeumannomyces hyphopodioides]
MFVCRIATTSVVLALVAAALGSGITDEVRSGFRMGGSLLPRQTKDLQAFSGSLGGAKAQSITQSSDQKRPFEVNGDTFTDFRSAANRACDNQKNSCADMANGSKKGEFAVGDCDKQNGMMARPRWRLFCCPLLDASIAHVQGIGPFSEAHPANSPFLYQRNASLRQHLPRRLPSTPSSAQTPSLTSSAMYEALRAGGFPLVPQSLFFFFFFSITTFGPSTRKSSFVSVPTKALV